MQVGQAALAAKHAADGAALGQVATLSHDDIGRGQFQRQRELHFLVPRVVGGSNTHAPFQKDHGPIAAVAMGAGDVQHFGVLQALGGTAGGLIRHAGA